MKSDLNARTLLPKEFSVFSSNLSSAEKSPGKEVVNARAVPLHMAARATRATKLSWCLKNFNYVFA